MLKWFKSLSEGVPFMQRSNKYSVPALEKAFAIIDMLAKQDEPAGISDLCRQLDLPKTSVFFILNTLEHYEYIVKTEDGKYQLGTKWIGIGLSVLSKIDLVKLAKPFLEQLRSETGFTVHLAILNEGHAMYIDKLENQSFVKFSTYVGQRQPLHASGVGKAIAAYLSAEELKRIIQTHGLPERTKNTLTNPEQFMEALETVRTLGYALEDEEGEYGIRCIGAPVFDHQGQLKAAISITALRTDLPVHEIPRIGEKVKRAALRISERLGYRG
jgi:DNA-binding IclR family transcriptional regulator